MAVLADDDVVEHLDAERPRHLHDLPGHLHIGLRRRRIARGMIVHQDERGGRQFERALDHLARIDRRVVDRALLQHLVGDQLVLLVEEQDAELQ